MPKPHSERFAWREILRLAWKAIESGKVSPYVDTIADIADGMHQQVLSGVHANPPLLIFGNPRRRVRRNPSAGEKFSSNVLAVLYVHDADGENYAHGFANAELDLQTLRDGTVKIGGLPMETEVEMIAQDDGSVLLRGKHGQRLWDTF